MFQRFGDFGVGNKIITDSALLRTFNEAIAWCSVKADCLNAEASTRSKELESLAFNMEYGKSSTNERKDIITKIFSSRRKILAEENIPVNYQNADICGGEILAYEIDQTDSCGLSPPESGGFIDDDDMPGWDTWFHSSIHKNGDFVIYSWVPPSFIELAQGAIDTNPVDCIYFIKLSKLFRRYVYK